MEDRLNYIKQCAEERSQLQYSCLEKLDLSKIKTKEDLSRIRLEFDLCKNDNKMNYPCIAEMENRSNFIK